MTKKKYTTEEVIKIFSELGYEYVSGECKNQYEKITIKDANGYLFYNHIGNISRRNTNKMQPFGIANPYTIKNIKNFLRLNNSDTELVDSEFVKSTYKMTWVCGRCKKEFIRSWNKMSQSATLCCDKCSHEIGIEKKKLTPEQVSDILKDKGWLLLEGEKYQANNSYINVINAEGFKARTTITNIKSSKQDIDIINKRNPYTIYNINLMLQKEKMPFKVISESYNGNDNSLNWLCLECNTTFKRSWATYQNGKSRLCPNCSLKSKSYISWKTKMWLDENNISYTMEESFPTCKDVRPLPFDYYLDELNILIEVDGKNHFQEVQFSKTKRIKSDGTVRDGFKELQLHDQIKNDWAKENKIKLIRLPYWEFKDDTYKETLKREILN